MKRIVAFAILLISVLLIETAALSNWYILPVIPDILLIVVIYIGLHNGTTLGQLSGFASGILIDFLSATPFGLNSLVRTVVGFLSGLLHLNVQTKGLFMPILYGFLATMCKAFIIFIVSFFYPGKIMLYPFFTSTVWYEAIFNALLSPVVFWVLAFFDIFSSKYRAETYE